MSSERGASGTVPYVKFVPGYCITFIKTLDEGLNKQLLAEVESRTQGQGHKKNEAKDSLSEDRPSGGQGPRTQPQVFSKKKRSSKKVFQAISNS